MVDRNGTSFTSFWTKGTDAYCVITSLALEGAARLAADRMHAVPTLDPLCVVSWRPARNDFACTAYRVAGEARYVMESCRWARQFHR